MKFIDGKNTRSDVQRVIRHIVPILREYIKPIILIMIGVLLCNRLNGERSIQGDHSNSSSTGFNYQVLCEPTILVKLYQIPSESPKTGVE